MKAVYQTKNGRLNVELEASTHKELWKQLASFQEVFEETKCGKCKKENLRFVIRKSKDAKGKEYEYHELRCVDCGAKLAFGVLDDGSGSLFPKRKNDDGSVRGEWGWVKWNQEKQVEE